MPATLLPYFQKLLVLYFMLGMHVILDTPGGSGLYLSFNIIGWIFTILFIALGLWQISLNQKVYYSKFQVWAVLGFFLLCLPMFYSHDINGGEFSDHAIPRILGLAGGLLFWFILSQFYFPSSLTNKHNTQKKELSLESLKRWAAKKSYQNILVYILYAVAIEAVFALIQVFVLSPGDWGGYKPGISRPHGVFLQPNVMASFMATGLAVALYLSVNLRYLTHKKFNKALIFFVLAASSFLLVLLQSRSGHLSASIVLVLLGIYVYQQNKKQALRTLSTALLGTLLGIACLIFSGDDLKHRSSDNYQTPGARPNTYIVTTEMFLRNPLQGVGYGLYERAFLDTYNDMVITRPELLPVQHRMAHPHNEVLLWVSEGGVAALLGLLCFALGYIAVWRKIPKSKAWAILGLITPLLLHSQLEFPFYTSLSHWLIFIILIWVAEIHSKSAYYAFTLYQTFFVRSMALIISFIFIPFFVTTLHTAHIIVNFQKNYDQDISVFLKIINPIGWQRQIDRYTYAQILYSGIKHKNIEPVKSYLEWGLQHIRYKPSVNVYSNTLLCYKILGEQAKYDALLQEAKVTYPKQEKWGESFLQHETKVQNTASQPSK